MSTLHKIMVLNDGETYTALKGCEILLVTDAALKRLDEGYQPKDLDEGKEIVASIGLEDVV